MHSWAVTRKPTCKELLITCVHYSLLWTWSPISYRLPTERWDSNSQGNNSRPRAHERAGEPNFQILLTGILWPARTDGLNTNKNFVHSETRFLNSSGMRTASSYAVPTGNSPDVYFGVKFPSSNEICVINIDDLLDNNLDVNSGEMFQRSREMWRASRYANSTANKPDVHSRLTSKWNVFCQFLRRIILKWSYHDLRANVKLNV
jgi:hypothetical protein